MGEPGPDRKHPDPGVMPDSPAARTSRTEWIALGLSAVWLGMVGAFWVFVPHGSSEAGLDAASVILTLVGIVLPIVMIWVAAITTRTAREMRAEAQALRASVEAMRAAWVSQNQVRSGAGQALEKKLDEVAMAARQAETALATFSSRRDHGAVQPSADRKAALVPPKPAAPVDDQPTLALGTPAEELAPPVSMADFIRAMQFPDNAEDKEGFRALRRALENRTMAKLLRAAQDVLNLLAQDGIYMDDLKPDRARPELWRRFAQGERGREIAALGGVRDRSSLALTAGRMRTDTIFRDAAHHFLRQFDRTFVEFEQNATDQEVAELAETRTARAFMLLGRVTGTFD
ncbi:hypothetical protein C8J27_10244 [Rhodobacter aestuarii]|uniref:Uncharacterized protein n=1 Tax=Rhodobacter aestuarii TaxID=453582 RepID=A0A1N7N5J9_9RHOB|nr:MULTISPECIES: hypothetical protein [Rhodobacter]PTV96250.1 hypothetical protein C8J27_10244 [Rhodobacter aestuarii]SIS93625.1 hypothetical protein SAMN05421580_10744 [Rhodobacter aestuarii]SOB93394.1 hypothetical protein SAMN05877809_101688 [Rhodobacter sp. JA431]